MEEILAIDVSGSVGGRADYFSYVEKLFNDNPNAKCILWNDLVCVPGGKAGEDNRKLTLEWIKKRQGGGGTAPSMISYELPPLSKLILVTDGEVTEKEVDLCNLRLNGKSFESVDCHFVGKERSMNLGVSAAFTKETKAKVTVNGEVLANVNTAVKIDLEKYGTFGTLCDGYEELLKQVKMKCLGLPPNKELHDRFVALQKKILRELSMRNTENKYPLTPNDYEENIRVFKKMIDDEGTTDGDKVKHMINELLKACTETKNFSFSTLISNRFVAAKVQHEEEATPEEEYKGKPFECPILMEDNGDEPVLLIKTGNNLFDGLEKGYVDSLINNPLLINDELRNKIRERLCVPISFTTATKLFKYNYTVKDPHTNQDVTCFVAFNKECDANVNYGLASFFGGKLVGVPELWLCVLQRVIDETSWMNEAFKDRVTQYLIARLEKCNTNISLSGLPDMAPIMKKVPVIHAITYCMLTPLFLTDGNYNRLRALSSTGYEYLHIMDMCSYTYPSSLKEKINVYLSFSWLMMVAKTKTPQVMKDILRARYQNYMMIDNHIVFLDGKGTEAYPLPSFAERVGLTGLLELSKLVDTQKKVGDINLEREFNDNKDYPDAVTNYCYEDNTPHEKKILIDPQTYRPYKNDVVSGRPWQEEAEITHGGPINKQVSCYNYFGKFICDTDRYPLKSELILYMAHKEKNRGMNTLPKLITQFVDDLFEAYQPIIDTITPKEFKERWSIT
jgi:hypothetical protein